MCETWVSGLLQVWLPSDSILIVVKADGACPVPEE